MCSVAPGAETAAEAANDSGTWKQTGAGRRPRGRHHRVQDVAARSAGLCAAWRRVRRQRRRRPTITERGSTPGPAGGCGGRRCCIARRVAAAGRYKRATEGRPLHRGGRPAQRAVFPTAAGGSPCPARRRSSDICIRTPNGVTSGPLRNRRGPCPDDARGHPAVPAPTGLLQRRTGYAFC